ncbi:glucose-1-phosphate cytidylyltransferase RfbF1 [Butyrivibrio proteoclasticus B316]|uniref:Glucose-1-phosphate cytidylyltransferase RfbF1 n=1 Tax=Butyrivibrio proteoclasticus (strain ATCC 51982 / DSM 14932 / B316) TaxID=515622 RepID=E0S232_BUTPB|nr:sugar phosphate nucleotidyltransferase [Butyrivibrio proteoclasticus]ADL33857.1 glucose-1-phosphate cytidylyltransferase RfbF1 [Butyrivibrio proteoclasticus B316]
MKMVILAGGQKSTISNEPVGVPKPMIPIGERPLLWHIMKHASIHGINDFIICGGYKVETIKEYFLDYYIYQADIKVNTEKNTVEILSQDKEHWNISVIDTGIETKPTERVKRVLGIIDDDFILSYGDCISDIPLEKVMEYHKKEKKDMTIVVARPTGRKVPLSFFADKEKWDSINEAWTSAGTFAISKDAFEKVSKVGDIEEVLSELSVSFYRHGGFFSTIETLRDKVAAEEKWKQGNAPWMECV